MALSEKKKISNRRWNEANYKQVKLSMPNAEAEALDTYCKEKGLTKAGFIRALVKEAIVREYVPGESELTS